MSIGSQSNSFRLASDRDYRRGVILGLTLAEVLLLLIFLLLLAAGAIMARAERRTAAAVARSASLEREVAPLLQALNRQGQSVTSADELAAIIRRAHEADSLESELSASHDARVKTEQQNLALQEALQAARLERDGDKHALEIARQNLASAKAESDKLAYLKTAMQTLGDVPGGIGPHPEQVLSNMLGQYKQAMQELSRLKGNGSGLPYCWVTPAGQPVYMLTFELRDGGFVVHEQDQRPRPDDPAWSLLRNLRRDTLFSESELASMVDPLVADAARRQCRYAVDVVDRTSPTNKRDYRHLNYVLDLSFARRELNK